jgi:integrase
VSIERTKGGWRVRWRDATGRNRAKATGPRKADAIAFEQEVKRAQRLGLLAAPDAGQTTLLDFGQTYWKRHIRKLAPSTQRAYADLWDSHVLPYLGAHRLREIRVGEVEDWLGELEARGVGRESQRKALKLLGAALEKALAWEAMVGTNPVRHVTPPKHTKRAIVPLDPEGVEAIRRALLAKKRLGDATMLSTVAYAGLRVPSEIIDLTWADVRDRTILVNASSKTGRTRAVDLLAPLASDLAEWRLACGRPFGDAPVFPGHDGKKWTRSGYAKWSQRVFKPLAPAGVSPYQLRHTFVSLLIREGRNVVDVAAQAGHSPNVCLDNYAHLFSELEGKGSAEDAIRAARVQEVLMDTQKEGIAT